jgi:hypothetical protein
MLATLRRLKGNNENGDAIYHLRKNERVPKWGPFTAEELAVHPLIFQIKDEFTRIFSTLHESAYGVGYIIYDKPSSHGEGESDRVDELVFAASRPDVGDGMICFTIAKGNHDGTRRRIKCRYELTREGAGVAPDGYLRVITAPQMVYTMELQQRADGTFDHDQIAALCSEVMKLRDAKFIDIPIAPTLSA